MTLLETRHLKNMDAPYKEDVMDIVSNQHLVDVIANEEIKSIDTNKEEAFYICGDNLIPLFGMKSPHSANVWHTPNVVKNVCGMNKPKSVHMHGPYMSVQSSQDRLTNKTLFSFGIGVGCAVGIDGMRCEVPSGDEYLFPWSDEFYDRIQKRGASVIDDVKTMNCYYQDDIDGSNNKECTIYAGETYSPFRSLVSEELWEHENSITPVMWIHEEDTTGSVEKTAHKKMRCVFLETNKAPMKTKIKDNLYSLLFLHETAEKSKRKRVLSCFFQ